MTGIYVRIERDGRAQAVELDQLTDAELAACAARHPAADGWRWAIALAQWIREHVREEAREG